MADRIEEERLEGQAPMGGRKLGESRRSGTLGLGGSVKSCTAANFRTPTPAASIPVVWQLQPHPVAPW